MSEYPDGASVHFNAEDIIDSNMIEQAWKLEKNLIDLEDEGFEWSVSMN